MEAFSELKTPAFVFDFPAIRRQLTTIANKDKNATEADIHTRSLYRGNSGDSPLVWVGRDGVDHRADTLLAWLHRVDEIGLSEQSFGVAAMESDLKRMRTLDFDEQDNTINQVAARLEYRLTKACLRYVFGQRFGFINPHRTFNALDRAQSDTVNHVYKYRGMFDVEMDLPTKAYTDKVIAKLRSDSLSALLREVQPHDKMYEQLKAMLSKADSAQERRRILCNMERRRWRMHQPIKENEKRIVVNIPAFELYAYAADSVMPMRVVCGAVGTTTPQLSSYIEYMEVNPRWNIPYSIIKKDVAHRAGDSSYFTRNRYQIFDSSGKVVPAGSVSSQMLLSGRYHVSQVGGAGNALGRIVFRFKNKFSVYLHDTSNPSAFQRSVRALSHGCVRVSKPFELAEFLLATSDTWLLDRIRLAMGKPAATEQGREYVKNHGTDACKSLVSRVSLDARVPLYIIYYTIWPDETGTLRTWPDIYNHDQVIWRQLQPYMQ